MTKFPSIILLVFLLLLSVSSGHSHQSDLLELAGPYLGQEPPSNIPELCPNVTADKKYLFFNRNHGEKGDLRIFWVSAKIIEDIKSQVLK